MEKIEIESPSKVNIGLNVIEKRDDDYHNLETVFYPLLLSDNLTFQKSNQFAFLSNSEILNKLDNNLITKAIRLLEKKIAIEIKVSIFIKKIIPFGGGLGGGSSNAAATLKAINKLFQLELSNEYLVEIALELGSDVPFFLHPIPSYAESRGEKLFPINFEIQYPILIVNPGINISTSWAFERVKPLRPEYNLRGVFDEQKIDFNIMKSYVKNDFESIVFKDYPQIKKIKEELYEKGAKFALMSGTGSTVYGIFSNLQKAFRAEEYFRQSYFTYLNNPFDKGSIT
ncbi:MAG: 4-(cytidine 5'-diphospho)-2-C-methyl-D-erythritol kinase [Ignavibacteriaceae bacterium]